MAAMLCVSFTMPEYGDILRKGEQIEDFIDDFVQLEMESHLSFFD